MVEVIFFQSRNRDTDIENKYKDTKGKRRGGRKWETGVGIYTKLILYVK